LAGDGTLRLMLDQLRGIFVTPATPASGGTLTSLSQVGISTQADGSLKLDSSKLNTAIANNFSDVTNLFSSATGFATRLDAWATSAVKFDGLIDLRTTSINTSIKGYNEQISKLELKMTELQKQYTTTYTNLNAMLSSMNATSAYLTQAFATTTNN
jgi:flagellar hook-associated protein 2